MARDSRIAVGIRRAVAALEPHLIRAMALRPFDEEFRVGRDAAFRIGVELDHPAVETLGIGLANAPSRSEPSRWAYENVSAHAPPPPEVGLITPSTGAPYCT